MGPVFKRLSVTLLVLVLLCGIGLVVPLDTMANLLNGWVLSLYRLVPHVQVEWGRVTLALIGLALVAGGAPRFLGWLHARVRGDDRRGPARRTLSMVAGVVLLFVAGIAAAGFTHQMGWFSTATQPLVRMARKAEWRSESTINLKLIGLGFHNYHGAYDVFPPGGTFGPSGEPLHGWMTALLPFEAMYVDIDFARPWTDPRNRAAYQTLFPTYINPAVPARHDAAGYALSHYAGNAYVLGGNVPRKLGDLVDGASTTLLAGEARENFKPWGSPTNWRDPALGLNRSPNGFGSPFRGGANMLFADGSVRFIKDTIDPKVFRALGTPDAGEPIGPQDD